MGTQKRIQYEHVFMTIHRWSKLLPKMLMDTADILYRYVYFHIDTFICRMQNALNDQILPVINMGIKDPSVLMNLEGFDLGDEMIPDYMHSVLLGVTQQYIEIILMSWEKILYWFAKLAIINQCLTSIQHVSYDYQEHLKNKSVEKFWNGTPG